MNPLNAVNSALAQNTWLGPTIRSVFGLAEADITYNFMVLVDFQPIGEFQAIDGITRAVETEAIPEGGRNYGPHIKIKQGAEMSVVLKWGMTDRGFMWKWMDAVQVGKEFRQEVLIVQFNRMMVPVRRFVLMGAFPRRVSSAALDSSGSTMAVDEVELVYDQLNASIHEMANTASAAATAGMRAMGL